MTQLDAVARKQVAERVKARRDELGLTQRELADLAAVSPNTVYGLETARRWPQVRVRTAIEITLGLKLGDLDRAAGIETENRDLATRGQSVVMDIQSDLSRMDLEAKTPEQETRYAILVGIVRAVREQIDKLAPPSAFEYAARAFEPDEYKLTLSGAGRTVTSGTEAEASVAMVSVSSFTASAEVTPATVRNEVSGTPAEIRAGLWAAHEEATRFADYARALGADEQVVSRFAAAAMDLALSAAVKAGVATVEPLGERTITTLEVPAGLIATATDPDTDDPAPSS